MNHSKQLAQHYRRQIAELATRYKLAAGLRDIYVEGPTDKFFLDWFFTKRLLSNVKVYEIDTVDVPPDLTKNSALGKAAARVFALASSLEQRLGVDHPSVRCLIDRDFAGISYPLPTSTLLLITDFCSIDSYATSFDQVQKFFKIFFGKDLPPVAFQSIQDVLVATFFFRAAKQELCSASPWIGSVTKCCSIQHGIVSLNSDIFQRA